MRPTAKSPNLSWRGAAGKPPPSTKVISTAALGQNIGLERNLIDYLDDLRDFAAGYVDLNSWRSGEPRRGFPRWMPMFLRAKPPASLAKLVKKTLPGPAIGWMTSPPPAALEISSAAFPKLYGDGAQLAGAPPDDYRGDDAESQQQREKYSQGNTAIRSHLVRAERGLFPRTPGDPHPFGSLPALSPPHTWQRQSFETGHIQRRRFYRGG